MKKITWLFLSLMLFLGVGMASAQSDEGGSDVPAVTLPTPAFTPGNNATVPPGTRITITFPEDVQADLDADNYLAAVILYVENDDTTKLTSDRATLSALVQAALGTGGGGPEIEDEGKTEAGYKVAVYDPSYFRMWMTNVIVSANASGATKIRMRLALVPYSGNIAYSDEFVANYTVDANAAAPDPTKPAAPTFSIVEIEGVQCLVIENEYGDNLLYMILYSLDGTDDDFNITDPDEFYNMEYKGEPIPIEYLEGHTIKAVTVQFINYQTGEFAMSDIATYPEPVEPPVAPTFNPNGGEVTLDQQISLATTTEGVSIYYTMESEMVPDFSTITTEEGLEEASAFMLYDDDDKITLGNFILEEDLAEGDVEVTLMAAAAVIKDGNVTWSTTTKAPFTVKGIEPPANEVAQPVITPDGSEGHATIKLNEKVTITCATNDASIYYTLDGTTPDATKTLYEAPFLLPANTPVDQEITIRAIAIKDGVSSDPRRVALMVEAAGEGPDDPVTPPATPKAPSFSHTTGTMVAVGSEITLSIHPWPDTCFIYYVIGGSDEDFNLTYAQLKGTNNLTQYNEGTPITVPAAGAMTIKAATVSVSDKLQTVAWSTIREAQYTAVERPVAPTFNPDGGEITETTQITLTNGTEGDATPLKIYYTRKGEASIFDTKRTVSSLNSAMTGYSKSLWLYEGPITTTKDTTIHAATAKIIGEGNNAAVVWSEPVTRRFTIAGSTPVVPETPVAPTFDPNGGDIKANAEITITSTCSSCKIYYTNGTTASFVNITTKEDLEEQVSGSMATFFEYSPNAKPMLSEFAVETPGAKLSLSAAAVSIAANGTLTWSDVITKEFTVIAGDEPEPDVARPTITPGNDPGTARIGQMVTIECTTGDATIYYTIDESEPSARSIKYTEPFAITEDMMVMQTGVATPNGIVTVRAIAIKDDKTSELTRGRWEIIPNAPSFSVTEEEVVAGTKVEIKCVPAVAKIYYTIDGTVPTEESTVYTDSVEITSAMTLKAFAVLGQRESSVNTASYTIKEAPVVEEKDTLPMPKFNPVGGEVEKGTAVVLSCDTANAKIYYSINADTVTENSLEYTTAIVIDTAMTIKAIAVKDGFVTSKVAETAYTVKEELANEGRELAGVNVYPNPNSGMFYIELPVAATVDVFASNGVLVKSFTAPAGKATLSLDHSGIYFVRVAGEGRATVKRVIVR